MLCHSSNYTRLGQARISVSQTFLLDCFEAMWDCFTLIIIDKMPMEAFIRSWTFQVRVVFSSEVSCDNSDILSLSGETEGDNMKTYQVSMETIGAIDDTIGAEDGDPGYNEPVVFNQTDNQNQLVQAANDWRFFF